MSTESPNEDYVLVHKSKVRMSRARKFVIGTMAIGAIAAITGAGTFASFSASTDNSSAFTTGTIKLSNKVGGGNTCFSSKVDNTASPADDANLDANTTDCDALLSSNLKPGGSTTSVWVTVKNEGTETGKLVLFRPEACTAAYAVPGTNEVATLTGSSSGTWTVTVNGQTTAAIANGAANTAVDSAIEALSTVGTGGVTVTGAGPYTVTFTGRLAGVGGSNLTYSATGTDTAFTETTDGVTLAGSRALSVANGLCSRVSLKIQQVTALNGSTAVANAGCVFPYVAPAASAECAAGDGALVGTMDSTFTTAITRDLNGTMAAAAERFYKIDITLPHATTDVNSLACTNGYNASGTGCDNDIMNAKANFELRWQLNLA